MSEGVVGFEATGDFVSAEGSLTVRRRLSALVCHGRVSGLLCSLSSLLTMFL